MGMCEFRPKNSISADEIISGKAVSYLSDSLIGFDDYSATDDYSVRIDVHLSKYAIVDQAIVDQERNSFVKSCASRAKETKNLAIDRRIVLTLGDLVCDPYLFEDR